ncbi:MAG: hypothetical protein R2712_17295 [Vicinamibacterales bacterium]
MRIPLLVLSLGLAVVTVPARPSAQAPARHTGPMVEHFGAVFDVPDPGLLPPKDADLKLRFDVNTSPEAGDLNAGFDTVARFLNLHARAGCRGST